jgi:hypothetical protein
MWKIILYIIIPIWIILSILLGWFIFSFQFASGKPISPLDFLTFLLAIPFIFVPLLVFGLISNALLSIGINVPNIFSFASKRKPPQPTNQDDKSEK